MVGQSYAHPITHDRGNANRPEVLRRPEAVKSLRHYVQPDVVPAVPSLSQAQDVHSGLSRVPRAPLGYTRGGTDQPARAVDHQLASMRCETCSRPAMFVCSACRKAPYCSVDCQVCAFDVIKKGKGAYSC